jgi:hypothetical protein
MPANTQPIFPITPKVSFGKVLAANALTDGTGTVVLLYTAGVNGSKIDQIKFRHLGINVASVLRLFINDGSGLLAANFALAYEKSIPALAALSQVAESTDFDITITKNTTETAPPIPYLPAGYKIYGSVGTILGAGIMVSIHGADY